MCVMQMIPLNLIYHYMVSFVDSFRVHVTNGTQFNNKKGTILLGSICYKRKYMPINEGQESFVIRKITGESLFSN